MNKSAPDAPVELAGAEHEKEAHPLQLRLLVEVRRRGQEPGHLLCSMFIIFIDMNCLC